MVPKDDISVFAAAKRGWINISPGKSQPLQLGRERMSSQAVGGAVGHNPISIIIPCHRVVGAHGSLTGFSAGIQTKIKLLQAEGVDTSKFFIPQKGTAL